MVEHLIQTTDGLPARQRWDNWKETILAPVEAAPLAGAQSFTATRSVAVVGRATLIDTTSQPLSFARSAPDISRVGYDHACISVWMQGGLTIEPAGRAAVEIGAGDMMLCDLRRPYRVATIGPYRELRLLLPHDIFSSRIGRLESLSGSKVPRTDDLGALTSGYVASLFAALPTLSDEAAALGMDGAIHLLSNLFALAPAPEGSLGAALSNDAVLALAERCIQARIADPGLDAVGIARTIGVSRSRLYGAFTESSGVASAIREARLGRAGALLKTDAHRHRSIEEVARMCGFADYSTFARGFRTRFGRSPRAWRDGSADPGAPSRTLSGRDGP